MVRLIMGMKGSGKTKQLIELINNAAKDEPGNVVCIEANRNMTYDIHYHIRLIDAEEYKLSNYDLMRGFVSGLYAGNYDITNILVDATLKIGGHDKEELAAMIDRLAGLAQEHKVELAFTVSCALEDLPETLKGYAI